MPRHVSQRNWHVVSSALRVKDVACRRDSLAVSRSVTFARPPSQTRRRTTCVALFSASGCARLGFQDHGGFEERTSLLFGSFGGLVAAAVRCAVACDIALAAFDKVRAGSRIYRPIL